MVSIPNSIVPVTFFFFLKQGRGEKERRKDSAVTFSFALILKQFWASLVAQLVKKLPAMWETWVLPLGWEDPLEKARATHSSILAWRIPWTDSPGSGKELDAVSLLNHLKRDIHDTLGV